METLINPVQFSETFFEEVMISTERKYDNFAEDLIINEGGETSYLVDIDFTFGIDAKEKAIKSFSIYLKEVFDADGQNVWISKEEEKMIERNLEKNLDITFY